MRYFNYFDVRELFKSCSESEILECINSNAFDNLLVLLEVLDGLRSHIGVPIIITSSFRDVKHNKRVGGVPNSQHLLGQAIDFYCNGILPFSVFEMIKEFFEKSALKKFVGQVIVHDSYIHIGLRTQSQPKFFLYDKRTNKNSN